MNSIDLRTYSYNNEKLEDLLAEACEIIWKNCVYPISKTEMVSQEDITDFLYRADNSVWISNSLKTD